jgi:hypothetical protein
MWTKTEPDRLHKKLDTGDNPAPGIFKVRGSRGVVMIRRSNHRYELVAGANAQFSNAAFSLRKN